MGSYVPNTNDDRKAMLKTMGVLSMEDLYSVIPDEIILEDDLEIPQGLSELEVKTKMSKIAVKNVVFK